MRWKEPTTVVVLKEPNSGSRTSVCWFVLVTPLVRGSPVSVRLDIADDPHIVVQATWTWHACSLALLAPLE